MRARNTKPGFYTNPVLIELPADHRLLFLGIGALCDRRGLVQDRPRKIKDAVLRGLDTDVNAALDVLANTVDDDGTTLISRYVGANGVKVVKLHNFLVHNKPHCEEPENPLLCDIDGTAGVVRERYPNGPIRAQGRHSSGTVAAQGEHALYPESCILNPVSCMPLPAGPVQTQGPRGVSPSEETSDPGDGNLEPMADPAAVMSLISGIGKPMTADSGPRSPSAERRSEPDPMQQRTGDRGAGAEQRVDDGQQARRAAEALAAYVVKLDPAAQPNDVQLDVWAGHIARLVIRDRRPWDEITQVMAAAFEPGSWWASRVLNAADFARHYAKIRAQWQAAADAATAPTPEPDASPETMRSLYSTLESELADDGETAARAWIAKQKPNVRARLGKRLDKLLVAYTGNSSNTNGIEVTR